MPTQSSPEWRLSNQAIFKVLLTAGLVWAAIKLAPLLILVALALLLAVTLFPILKWLERRLPHWAAILVITLGVIVSLVAVIAGIIPAVVEQFTQIAKKLPELQATALNNIHNNYVHQLAQKLLSNPAISSDHVVAAGQAVLGAVSGLVLLVALAIYLTADGERAYQWIRAFFSVAHRRKLDQTAQECSRIIVAYVAGQLITSALCAVFVFVVMTLLKVPAALVLGVMAGLFDVLPLLGFFVFTATAVLFALTVSGGTALTVLALYIGYHLLENYLIVPKVYGSRLRLSDLVVLLSVLAGGYLAGIPGAILILPIVAAYPAFEKIWLVDYVGRDTVEKHG